MDICILVINVPSFMIVLLLSLSFIFLTKAVNTLTLLIISELFWITLYSAVLSLSVIMNNLVLLAFSLFFLMFSASEIAIGLVLFFLQRLVNFSLDLNHLVIVNPRPQLN